MDSENDNEIDPDYATQNIALKRAEKLKEEDVSSVEKLKEILNAEFNKELTERQNQLELIEKQLHKTRKLMHLMRYVLISSYYNKKELEYNGNDETSAKAETSYLFDQNRIHPALKKLLGKNGSAPDFNMCRSARRNKGDKPNLMVENLTSGKFKNSSSICSKASLNENTDGSSSSQQTIGFDRNRQKIKNQIIVGNISKWMPSSEEEKLTHKWMVYVRGPKENPDVSHFIEKVVFYLHPSYKPDDVVEISKPPFHLSRMGWGEFPIRLQIYFVCTMNKPVDIVHNLKLDKTYSGRQTLGNETIIDLYLYNDKLNDSSEFEDIPSQNISMDSENGDDRKHEIVAVTDICEMGESGTRSIEDSASNFEHDYCTEDIKPDISDVLLNMNDSMNTEHSYSYPPTHEFFNIEIKKEKVEPIEQENNPLIYGLDDSYSETNSDSKRKEPLFYRKSLVYTAKEAPVKNLHTTSVVKGKVVGTKRKSQESLLKKMYTKKLQAQVVVTSNDELGNSSSNIPILQLRLPRNEMSSLRFKNMGEVLPYIFKRLPLIMNSGKNRYSFTASSVEEYNSWSISKLASAEWIRAKMIKNLIESEQVHEHQKWTAKTIMLYGKSHGYTPKTNFSILEKNTVEVKMINNCFSSSANLPYNPPNYSAEISLDIENESVSPEKKKRKLSFVNISDPSLQQECSFIREEALECGIVLKNEQIQEDVVFNGAERMILEAVKCLANQLVRRSLHFSATSRTFNGEINTTHLQKALKERKDLEAISQFKAKQSNKKYFF